MTINELCEKLGLTNIGYDLEDFTIEGVYVGDLLSLVMGEGETNNLWVTVLHHQNVLAVAKLREFSGIIIVTEHELTPDFISLAKREEIPIMKTSLKTYELCKKLIKLGV